MLQLEFDRPQLSKMAGQVKAAFATVQGDKKGWSYVYAPDADYVGLLENALPTFWTAKLSRLLASAYSPSEPRTPKRMTVEQKMDKAREMRAQGAPYGEIGRALGGRSRSTIQNYPNGYPHQR